jgi:hypothetical protein
MIRTLPKAIRRGWMRMVPAALLGVVALGGSPAEAVAQEEMWLAEVGAYRLSDEGLGRFRQAIQNLVTAIEADPSIHHRGAEADGFEETIAFLEQEPAVGVRWRPRGCRRASTCFSRWRSSRPEW